MAKTPTVDERIAAGIKLLDKHFKGKKWRKKIDPSLLDMQMGIFEPKIKKCGCILAQLSPDHNFSGALLHELHRKYDAGVGRSRTEFAKDYGFTLFGTSWGYLTRKWKAALKNA